MPEMIERGVKRMPDEMTDSGEDAVLSTTSNSKLHEPARPVDPSAESPSPSSKTPPSQHREDETTISEYLESLLVTVILALFGTSFVVQAFKIPSPSMEK